MAMSLMGNDSPGWNYMRTAARRAAIEIGVRAGQQAILGPAQFHPNFSGSFLYGIGKTLH
jgi:hypothetical protein